MIIDDAPTLRCPQCGVHTNHHNFQGGVCVSCFRHNQSSLDEHNARFDEWERLSDSQRDSRIRDAARNY